MSKHVKSPQRPSWVVCAGNPGQTSDYVLTMTTNFSYPHSRQHATALNVNIQQKHVLYPTQSSLTAVNALLMSNDQDCNKQSAGVCGALQHAAFSSNVIQCKSFFSLNKLLAYL